MASTSTPPPVYGPRAFTVSANDQRGVVMSVSILFTVYALMIMGMRVSTKYRSMSLDDWLSVAATALAIPQLISIIVAVSHGFGAPYTLFSAEQKDSIASALRAADIFFLLALFTAKASMIWLCRRLFAVGQTGRHLACKIVVGFCAIWCLASILAVNLGCSSLSIIRAGDGTCSGLVSRWGAIGAIDCVTEILIYSLSVAVIFPLKMSWTSKFQASACFFLRLPIIIIIILNVTYLSKFAPAPNASIALTKPILFRQSQVIYALLSASIPTLNQYLRNFNTQNATSFGFQPSNYAKGSGGRTYQLQPLTKNSKRDIERSWNDSSNGGKMDDIVGKRTGNTFTRTSHAQYNATIEIQQNGAYDGISNISQEDASIGRHNSDEYIIHKDIRYEVRHES